MSPATGNREGVSTVNYYVEIVELETGHVEKRMGPMSERRAERTQDGANKNLDHENYYTRVVPEEA